MKKILIPIICAIFWMCNANATTYTVSNDPVNPAQYTSAQDAQDAASPGDTLYIYGSETHYGGLTIRKKLTVIGNGYDPITEGFPNYPTGIYISLSVLLNNSGTIISRADGSHIIGIKGNVGTDGDYGINDITIERCQGVFSAYVHNPNIFICKNWLIKNNVIDYFSLTNQSGHPAGFINFTFANNIIVSNIDTYLNGQNRNIRVINNLVLSMSIGSSAGNDRRGVYFQNNIFLTISWEEMDDNIFFCNFKNNLCFNGSENTIPIGDNNNTGSGNFDSAFSGNASGVDPLFVSYSLGVLPWDEENFHLQAGSPAKNAGTDGTDLGIYGGFFPWPEDSGYILMPSIPQIYEFDIKNAVVTPSEDLRINTKVRKPN